MLAKGDLELFLKLNVLAGLLCYSIERLSLRRVIASLCQTYWLGLFRLYLPNSLTYIQAEPMILSFNSPSIVSRHIR